MPSDKSIITLKTHWTNKIGPSILFIGFLLGLVPSPISHFSYYEKLFAILSWGPLTVIFLFNSLFNQLKLTKSYVIFQAIRFIPINNKFTWVSIQKIPISDILSININNMLMGISEPVMREEPFPRRLNNKIIQIKHKNGIIYMNGIQAKDVFHFKDTIDAMIAQLHNEPQ